MEGNVNSMVIALDRFQSVENPGNGQVNRANRKSTGNNSRTSTWHLEDGSYLRMQNITLGYTFNKNLLKKTPFQKLRLSATCNNVWMIVSHLPGIDPESVAATNTNAVGFENGGAPTNRSYTFNLTVGF